MIEKLRDRSLEGHLRMRMHPDLKNKELSSKKFKTFELRGDEFLYYYIVLPSDIDQFKHMSFANYVKLMYLAGDALFLSIYGKERIFEDELKLTKSALNFKKQSVIGDEISIRVKIYRISKTKIILGFTYKLLESGEEVANGWQEYESVASKIALIDQFRDRLEASTGMADTTIDPHEIFFEQKALNIYKYEKIKVFFKHTDYFGGLHPYNYFEWTSHVRESFFSDKCSNFQELLKGPISMMTSKIELQVLRDCAFADDLEARLSAIKVKKVSCDLIINYFDRTTQSYVAATTHSLVFFDPVLMKFTQIPETLRPAMIEYSEP